MSAFLIDDSDDIEASVRGDGDDVPDGLDRSLFANRGTSQQVPMFRNEETP